MADNHIVGTITQSTTPDTHLVRDVSTLLSKYEPDRFPLDTLLRQMQLRKKAEAVKIEWESYKSANRKMNVTAASVAAADAQTAATIPVDTSAGLAPDDILMPIVKAGSAFIPASNLPQLIVVSVPNSTSITVKAFSKIDKKAYVATPIIPKDTVLAFLSNAKKEGFTMSLPKMVVPVTEYNLCQLFDRVVRVSLTRKATKNYTTSQDWDTARREQLVEFRRSLEHAAWFGERAETADEVNDASDKRWKMGGVTEFIDKVIEYAPASLTELDLIDWMKTVFMGNNGSATRMLFCDSELSAAIQKTQAAKGRSMEQVRVAGLTCSKIVFNEGTLLLKHNRTFNELGLSHYGVILDMKQISKRELRAMTRKKINLEDQGTDADAEQYKEQSTIELLNPDCHAIVRGVAAA